MNFKIIENDGHLWADVQNDDVGLLSSFLEDASYDFPTYFEEINKAEKGIDIPTGLSFNHTSAEFYQDKAIIEHLWINEKAEIDGENYASVEISLSEAKQLLLDWQAALEKWRAKNPE